MGYWFKRKDSKEESQLLQNLRLIHVEKEIYDNKVEDLVDLARFHGMRGIELKSFIADLDPDKLKSPSNEDEKFEQLFYIISIILNDHIIDDAEFDFCIDYANRIGYDKNLCSEIIREIYTNVKIEATESQLRDLVRRITGK